MFLVLLEKNKLVFLHCFLYRYDSDIKYLN